MIDDDLFGPVKTGAVKVKKKPKSADKTIVKDSPITPCLVIKTSQCEATVWNLPIPSWLS